jgi:membrane associated rhomboid family serine protease
MVRRKRDLLYVSLLSALVGGAGVWLIGASNSVHIGASILVFGYLGYLLSRGIFERRFWPIVGSLVVFFLYGGALWGVLPGQPGISWEGHAFGLLGGIVSAWLMKPRDIAVRAVAR